MESESKATDSGDGLARRAHMAEIFSVAVYGIDEGREREREREREKKYWGDFYAKLLYEGRKEGSPLRQKNQLPGAAPLPPSRVLPTDYRLLLPLTGLTGMGRGAPGRRRVRGRLLWTRLE